jgi:hypothetical protein
VGGENHTQASLTPGKAPLPALRKLSESEGRSRRCAGKTVPQRTSFRTWNTPAGWNSLHRLGQAVPATDPAAVLCSDCMALVLHLAYIYFLADFFLQLIQNVITGVWQMISLRCFVQTVLGC